MQLHNDFLIKEFLWYQIGGIVKHLLVCRSKEDVLEAVEFVKKNQIQKIFVFGLGSNVLFTDEYFDGAAICITTPPGQKAFIDEQGLIEVYAGVEFDDLIKFSFENKLIGLEWAGGLPGTVGGAIRGNAGAFGGETKDNIVSVDILDLSEENPTLKTLTKQDLRFAYRESIVKKNKNLIVVSAKFKLEKADNDELSKAREVYETNIQYRKNRHPLEYPNCGSTFKNIREKDQIEKVLFIYPELKERVEKNWYGKVSVGTLIEMLGLKGLRIGDAQVSEKHALYIVNLGHAKAKDVLEIIDTIQKKFQDTFGFGLETEVEIVK